MNAKKPSTRRYGNLGGVALRKIAFTSDAKGRPIAYYWLGGAPIGRWIRTGLESAKITIATGSAIEVPYIKGQHEASLAYGPR